MPSGVPAIPIVVVLLVVSESRLMVGLNMAVPDVDCVMLPLFEAWRVTDWTAPVDTVAPVLKLMLPAAVREKPVVAFVSAPDCPIKLTGPAAVRVALPKARAVSPTAVLADPALATLTIMLPAEDPPTFVCRFIADEDLIVPPLVKMSPSTLRLNAPEVFALTCTPAGSTFPEGAAALMKTAPPDCGTDRVTILLLNWLAIRNAKVEFPIPSEPADRVMLAEVSALPLLPI